MKKQRYNVYSQYLKQKYGQKVYKIPINISVSCPNRQEFSRKGGCIFCGEEGAGFESLANTLSVSEQLQQNIAYISKKYKAKKFISYFQNFTNTYLPLSCFKKHIVSACSEDVVEISISTRPDCIHDRYLDFLKNIQDQRKINISIELGLQSVNYHTLKKINRGHSLAEFIDAVIRIKRYGFEICTHMILNLPWDNIDDVIEGAKVISALGIEHVKIHSLYIVKNTILAHMYQQGDFEMIPMEEYIDRVIVFLEYLNPNIVIQRLAGRAPEENTLFCNWNTSWWKIKDEIEKKMEEQDSYQGKHFLYLNGRALGNFVNL